MIGGRARGAGRWRSEGDMVREGVTMARLWGLVFQGAVHVRGEAMAR